MSLQTTSEDTETTRVYHGSIECNLDILVPHNRRTRDPNEGAVIFAARDIAFASTFLFSADDSWTRRGSFGGPYFVLICDRQRFDLANSGGCIYVLSNTGFISDPKKGMGKLELICRVPTKPIETLRYTSALEAMLEHQVQVYFVNESTFMAAGQSTDHGLSVLRSLTTENQVRDINPIPLTSQV